MFNAKSWIIKPNFHCFNEIYNELLEDLHGHPKKEVRQNHHSSDIAIAFFPLFQDVTIKSPMHKYSLLLYLMMSIFDSTHDQHFFGQINANVNTHSFTKYRTYWPGDLNLFLNIRFLYTHFPPIISINISQY